MKEYKIDLSNLVRQLLPTHKRQIVRLRILRCFVVPLVTLYVAFCQWRNRTRKLLNITCRAGVLEQVLREKHADESITIRSFKENGFALGLLPEGVLTAQAIGTAAEGTPCEVSLAGENREQFGGVDFIVTISAATDINVLRADLERYRPALTTYKIEQR